MLRPQHQGELAGEVNQTRLFQHEGGVALRLPSAGNDENAYEGHHAPSLLNVLVRVPLRPSINGTGGAGRYHHDAKAGQRQPLHPQR
jgi:hypothetical protein